MKIYRASRFSVRQRGRARGKGGRGYAARFCSGIRSCGEASRIRIRSSASTFVPRKSVVGLDWAGFREGILLLVRATFFIRRCARTAKHESDQKQSRASASCVVVVDLLG